MYRYNVNHLVITPIPSADLVFISIHHKKLNVMFKGIRVKNRLNMSEEALIRLIQMFSHSSSSITMVYKGLTPRMMMDTYDL